MWACATLQAVLNLQGAPSHSMLDDDAYRSGLQATIASLRYWVPSITDAARVEESETGGVWQLTVEPFFSTACPFVLRIGLDRLYSLRIGRETYADRPVESHELFLPLVEAIAEGRVYERHWQSANTAIATHAETVILLTDGGYWHGVTRWPGADLVGDAAECVGREVHFLPYRRTLQK